jgi:CDP-glucose 4,6-dehydratase
MEKLALKPAADAVILPAPAFWRGRKVFLTGHSGFKGSWLLLLLDRLGADVTGFSLAPPTDPSMFEMVGGASLCRHIIGDIRDLGAIERAMDEARPEIVLHLAAQPLVRASYTSPVETYATNLMGTVHVLDACRRSPSVRTIVSITTDKCYSNDGRENGYGEDDRLGGHDPYSNSKACAELAAAAYRDSFLAQGRIGLATARAGNVIGGGDFADDRLVPDAARAFAAGRPLAIRNANATRPWQHVLEPLVGYLLLAEKLHADPATFARGWNFGPSAQDVAPVGRVVEGFSRHWGAAHGIVPQPGAHPHEAATLTLDSSAAIDAIGWQPRLDLDEALKWSADWYRTAAQGGNVVALTQDQINHYLS